MNLRERVLKGVAWSAGLSVATQAATFATSLLLARILGKQVFGEWAMVQNTVGTIANIAQFSAAVTGTKFVAEFRHTSPQRIGTILGLCSVVTWTTATLAAAGLFVAAPYIAEELLHARHLTFAVRVSVGYLFFLTVNGYQVGALAGLEAFQRLAAVGVVSGVATALVVVTSAWKLGLEGALVALSLASAVNWALHHVYLRRHCRSQGIAVRYDNLRSEVSVLTGFALPATLSGLAGSAGVWLSNLALVQAARGYEEMAVLSAGMSLRSVILFAPSVFSRVSVPVLVNLFGNRDLDAYRRAFGKNLLVLSGSAFLAALPIAGLAPWLLSAFGRGFTTGGATVVALAAATVLEVAAMALYQQIFSSGWMWWGLSTVIVRSAILVAVASPLADTLGALGVAYAYLAAYGGALVLTYCIVRTKMPSILRSARQGAQPKQPS